MDQFKKLSPLARVGEAAVVEDGLGYHAGEGQHRQPAVGHLLELIVILHFVAEMNSVTQHSSGWQEEPNKRPREIRKKCGGEAGRRARISHEA